MRPFNFLGIVVTVVLLSACTKPGKVTPGTDGGYNNADATFRVESGKVEGFADPVIPGDKWQKPFSVTVQYSACLKDRARDEQILNQTFHIEVPGSKARVDSVKTTPSGCLVWNEPLPFNYFVKRSRWVTVERDIVGTGIHSGRRTATFAVNPWLIANRAEMNPAEPGYFLRDEPLDLNNPSDREAAVFEFFEKNFRSRAKGRALNVEEQKALDDWKRTLQAGYSKADSLLAPANLLNDVLAGTGDAAGIWIDQVRPISIKRRNLKVEIDADGKDIGDRGYLVEQVLQIQPRLRIRKADGSEEFEDIRNGSFDVYAHVMGTDLGKNQDNRVILTKNTEAAMSGGDWQPGKLPNGSGRIVDGKLFVAINYHVIGTAAEGNAELVLKLVPRGISVRKPNDFEGVFNLGKISSWISASTPAMLDVDRCVPLEDGSMNPKKTCDFEQYLNQSSDFAKMEQEGAVRRLHSYFFTNIKPRFVQVMQGSVSANKNGELVVVNGETATHRTVFYAASTCVTAATGERMSGGRFTIEYMPVVGADGKDDANIAGANRQAFDVTADDNGCLNWNNQVRHAYYKPEQFFKQVIEIRGASGFKRQKTVYINPWDDKFTFGFDEEELGKEFFERNAKSNRIASRFYLGDYSYHTVRFLYEIDPHMDLEVKKTVLIDLQPRVLRYSGLISGRKLTESLRDGIYLLKVGIQKSYLDPSDRFQKLCEVDRARQLQTKGGGFKTIVEKATVDDPNLCKLPREQRFLSLDDQARAARARGNSVETLNDNVVTKEFVTTKTTLVRVTDGLVIHPVELSMKDLRLMRIRSNFLVQLETVDESKVLLSDELSKQYRELTAQMILAARTNKETFRAQISNASSEEAAERTRDEFENDIRDAAEKARAGIKDLYESELNRLGDMRSIVSDFNTKPGDLNALLDRFSKIENPWTAFLRDNATLNMDDKAQYDKYVLYKKMAENDFTKISLPDCDRVNCNEFKQADSGLESRTFVGPVIFLSNSYKDAVRATDNLDEARCHEEIEGADFVKTDLPPLEADLLGFETSLLADNSRALEPKQSNNAYRYSRYFNSLRHFCTQVEPPTAEGQRSTVKFKPTQVDDLMGEERALKAEYQGKMKALATPYNLASIHNLEFVSYGGERLKKINETLAGTSCLEKGIDSCLVETDERTLQPAQLTQLANRDLQKRVSWVPAWPFSDYFPLFNPITRKTVFTDAEIKAAVFSKSYTGDEQAAVCSMLTSLISENALRVMSGLTPDALYIFESLAFAECVSQGKKGFIRDNKLRIYETGGYEFKGGLQMNFNVGSSFGVSRSEGVSTAMDFFDAGIMAGGAAGFMVGGAPGAAVGALAGFAAKALKPFDLKTSRSLSESKGTSIAEGTYLVGQIAKFKIPLKQWEQCSVLRFRPDAVQALATKIDGAGALSRTAFSHQGGAQLVNAFRRNGDGKVNSPAEYRAKLNAVFSRGLFVCDGVRRTQSTNGEGKLVDGKDIEELYFYFTQHFTEGDMLDQADLYNHPWLLSLRGLRDFSSFVELIRGQEAGSIGNFINGLIGQRPDSDTAGWSLAHMANTYKAIIPSFPGLYTVLDQGEGMDFFTLDDKKFSEFDMDINSEVHHQVIDPEQVSGQ